MIRQIFSRFGWQSFAQVVNSYLPVLLLMVIALGVHWFPVKWKEFYRGKFIETPVFVKLILAVLLVVLIFQFKASDIHPFIYFRF